MNIKALQVIFLFSTAFSLLVSGCKKEADLGELGIMWVENSPGTEASKPLYNVLLENKIQNKKLSNNDKYIQILKMQNILLSKKI